MMTTETDEAGCIKIDVGGSWLTNGYLQVCILKLTPPSVDEWQNDKARIENLAIVTQLLTATTGASQSLLMQEFPAKPSLVLSPELVFGFPDFDSLNSLIKQHNNNLIFICGFGFSDGNRLSELAGREGVEGVWKNPPNPNKKYNGGWVWIKIENSIKCFIFLKNFFEQSHEISIPNLESGDSILRLNGDDLIIFPLVCADLISTEVNSPRSRIIKSLSKDGASNKKVLITGSLLNVKSDSGHWKAAIGDLLEQTKASNSRLILSNCINPSPEQHEEVDKWRCLSGVFQYREGCKPPKMALPNIRYVEDTKFSGLVLRKTQSGAAFGPVKWTNNSSEGLHALSTCSHHIWVNEKLHFCDGICAADELYRFVVRNRGRFLHEKISSNSSAKSLSSSELDKLISELSPDSNSQLRSVAGNLFLKCLKGVKKDAKLCPDQLHHQSASLDCAITTLKLLQHAIDAKLLPVDKELAYGQLLSSDSEQEILVWDSSEHTANQLYEMLAEGIVVEGGSARVLTVIGRGNGGGSAPSDGRIKSKRLSDISNPPLSTSNTNSGQDKDICEHSDRVVFWKNQGKIDDILADTDPNQNLVDSLKKEIIQEE